MSSGKVERAVAGLYRWVLPALLLALVAAIAVGVLVPIYIDETATLLGRARWLDDGANLVGIFPQCHETYLSPIPFTWWPGALVYEAVFGWAGPLGRKIVGVSMALFWLAGLLIGIRLAFPDRNWRRLWLTVSLSALCLGTLPLVYTLTRAEQWQSLILVVLLLLYLKAGPIRDGHGLLRGGVAVFSLCLISAFYFIHPKALLYTPFVLALLFLTWRSHGKAAVSAMLAAVLVLVYQTRQFTLATSRCDEVPLLGSALARYTVPLSQFTADPLGVISQGVTNMANAVGALVYHARFADQVQASWLPPVETAGLGFLIPAMNGMIALLIGGGAIATVLLVSAFFVSGAFKKRLSENRVLAFCLVSGVVAQAFLYHRTWFFYNAGLAVPVLLLAVLLLSRDFAPASGPKDWHRNIALGAAGVGLTSLVLLFVLFLPALSSVNETARTHLGNQVFSTQAIHSGPQLASIRRLAPYCGLAVEKETALLVDDMTYHAFDTLLRPVHVFQVSEELPLGRDLRGRLAGFLSGLGGRGFIMRCERVPPQLRHRVQAWNAGYCCGRIAP